MKQQAIAGEIRIEEGLGNSMANVVGEYIAALEAQKLVAGKLDRLSGWGGLPSAQAIRQKLEFKAATGSADDPDDSATKRLDQHISIARDQRDTFLAAIGKLHSTDQQSADTLTNGGI
ncbi:hypothetical protein [Nocardia asteroides]|uniref:hypothetical protein n=1 Tax=Nocardia asteroides TaxID=1824 RepID=UPI001E369D39|nr:hypothetical protein [Nocardia asteroides]UGT59980.1 hypothetical protein LTT61_22525 [Nocardia asteroides]